MTIWISIGCALVLIDLLWDFFFGPEETKEVFFEYIREHPFLMAASIFISVFIWPLYLFELFFKIKEK